MDPLVSLTILLMCAGSSPVFKVKSIYVMPRSSKILFRLFVIRISLLSFVGGNIILLDNLSSKILHPKVIYWTYLTYMIIILDI